MKCVFIKTGGNEQTCPVKEPPNTKPVAELNVGAKILLKGMSLLLCIRSQLLFSPSLISELKSNASPEIRMSSNGNSTSYLTDSNRDYAQVLYEKGPSSELNYTFGSDLVGL